MRFISLRSFRSGDSYLLNPHDIHSCNVVHYSHDDATRLQFRYEWMQPIEVRETPHEIARLISEAQQEETELKSGTPDQDSESTVRQ